MSRFYECDSIAVESAISDMTPVEEGWKMVFLKLLSKFGVMTGKYDEKVKLSNDNIKKVFDDPSVVKWVAEKNKEILKFLADDADKKGYKGSKFSNFKSESELNQWYEKYNYYGITADNSVSSLAFKEKSTHGGAVWVTVMCGKVFICVIGDTEKINRIVIPYKAEIKRDNKYVDPGVVDYVLGAPTNVELANLVGSIH